MFRTVMTTSVMSATTSCVCRLAAFRLCQPRPFSAGMSASGSVATTAVMVRMPADRWIQPLKQGEGRVGRELGHWETGAAVGEWLRAPGEVGREEEWAERGHRAGQER